MKKAKIAFWLILMGFLVLLAYQNWDFFMSEHRLRLNLFVIDEFSTPNLQNAILFLIFFFTGILISYFITLVERFKLKRTIKALNTALEMNQKELEELKKQSPVIANKDETPPITSPDVATSHHEDKDSDVS
jgi:heme/copper-type cytochrome/quinol oxidase subunit 1